MRRGRAGAGPALLALMFLVSCAAPAMGSGVRTEASTAREANLFWSTARMREAKPLEVTAAGSSTRGRLHGGERGRPRRIAPAARSNDFEADFEAVSDSTAPAFRVHGAVFVSLGIFGYGRCSGTAVRSRNQSVVFTAAHCINSGGRGGRWTKNRWVFVPAYRYGQRPFGVFPARWLDTTRQWRASGSENYDVGAAVVGPNQRGETLGEAVGGAGIAWNLKPRQSFEVHGYPAEDPFDGETQRFCPAAKYLGHDPVSFLLPGPLSLAVSCTVNGGASGGGWTIGGDTLNSVTDYGYADAGSPDFGAYFGKEVARLYHRAARVR